MSFATTKTTSSKAGRKNKQQKKNPQQNQIPSENDDNVNVPKTDATAAGRGKTKKQNQTIDDNKCAPSTGTGTGTGAVTSTSTVTVTGAGFGTGTGTGTGTGAATVTGAGTIISDEIDGAFSGSSSNSNKNNNKNNLDVIQVITNIEDYYKGLKTAGDRLVIVEFFADWCKPCRILNPALDELATTYGNRISILKIDIDHMEDLVQDFDINSIPTVIFMRNEQKLTQISGAKKTQLEETVLVLLRQLSSPSDVSKVGQAAAVEVTTTSSKTNVEEANMPLNIPVVELIKIPSVTRTQSNVTTKSSTTGTTTTTTTSKTKEALPTTTTNSRVDSEPTIVAAAAAAAAAAPAAAEGTNKKSNVNAANVNANADMSNTETSKAQPKSNK